MRDSGLKCPRLPYGFLGVAGSGTLTVDGVEAVELAHTFGTPLFVFVERAIRFNFREFRDALKSAYCRSLILYACKANGLLAVLRILEQEGAGIDVVSEGELFLARRAGFSCERIVFNGNSKSEREITLAVSNGVLINADSVDELQIISRVAQKIGAVARVCLRVVPDVHSGTIPEWATGIPESKFGLDVKSGEAWEAAQLASRMAGIDLVGLHCHIGSQLEQLEPYELAASRVAEFACKLKEDLGVDVRVVNLGGGYGVPFAGDPAIPPVREFAHVVGATFAKKVASLGLGEVLLAVEPGASLVGNAALVLLSVNAVKVRKSGVTWVMVDGGADILLRATQGWYSFPIIDAAQPSAALVVKAHIAGPLCYSGDVLARDVDLPSVGPGSVLAVLDAGAYTLCLANHYNGRLAPAVVLLKDGVPHLVRRRGQPTDLISSDVLPHHLA